MHSNTTNIVKDIFITPTEDIQKKTQKKNLRILIPDKFLKNVTKFH